jgi:hypothetical protein
VLKPGILESFEIVNIYVGASGTYSGNDATNALIMTGARGRVVG